MVGNTACCAIRDRSVVSLAVAALAVAVIAVALRALRRRRRRLPVTARFENASQLVKGNEVQVSGKAIGTVEDITLTDDGGADVDMKITDPELHAAARAAPRRSSA